MRTTMFVLIAVSFSYVSLCQGLPNFDTIRLDAKADYKAAEPYALQAATFLLNTPHQKDNLERLNSMAFIIKWMSGTPDYMFSIDDTVSKMTKSNDEEILGLYMAAMTKYVLENKDAAGDQKRIKLNAVTMLLEYCENPANKIKMSKGMKKLSEAKAEGELEQVLSGK